MTLILTLGASLIGGFVSYFALAFISRDRPRASTKGRTYQRVFSAFVLLVLIDVCFVIVRSFGLLVTGQPEDLSVVLESFYHWTAFSAGIALGYWYDAP